jgi:bifunctional non-homologous end joining protein LigD
LFDLLHLDGVDIADAPLLERKALLHSVLEGQGRPLAFSSHVQGDGDEAYRLAGEQHFEGIISKRADRSYRSGRSEVGADQTAGQRRVRGGRIHRAEGQPHGFGSLLLARQTRNMAGSTSAASGPGSRTN